MNNRVFNKNKIALAISVLTGLPATVIPLGANAQENTIEEVMVTASRRAESIQDIPLNITALTGDNLEQKRLSSLAEIARTVPGMTFVDQGPRSPSNNIIVRGLNTGSTGPAMVASDYKTSVATYMGEIPLFINLKTYDLERVETLIGPQGTLYGAGTLGGAVRYIPNKPNIDEVEGYVRGTLYQYSEADKDVSRNLSAALNIPLGDDFAVRTAFEYINDTGFVDYNFVVREPGVSLPQPDFSDESEVQRNLRQVEDANGQETISARTALRWTPGDNVDATLTYWYQNIRAEGRSVTHQKTLQGVVDLDDYESALRYEEPNDIENQLLTLEVTADLGFAELTSATGYSQNKEIGQRDQTDLLLNFEYGYEAFPAFSAFTLEDERFETYTQELRLVSTNEGPFQWIAGVFFNEIDIEEFSSEFTPGFDVFAVSELGGTALRPDSLEYFSELREEISEKAIFGEVSLELSAVTFTLGARLYEYKDTVEQGFDLPLFNTVFDGAPANVVSVDLSEGDTDDSGSLFKFNVAYDASDDILLYATLSEGYRIGGVNAITPCDGEEVGNAQALCALPNEEAYEPDTTLNKELGWRSTWMDGRLIANGAVYHIDWDDIQVPGLTQNGDLNITKNGGKAVSQGVELSFSYQLTDQLTVDATYGYTDASLDEDVARTEAQLAAGQDGLVRGDDAFDGDTLPGSPDQSGSLGVAFSENIGNYTLDLNYFLTYTGEIYTTIGARGNSESDNPFGENNPRGYGEVLGGYSLHNFSATLSRDAWETTFFIDNISDKYAVTATRLDVTRARDISGVRERSYGQYVTPPRNIGVKMKYSF